MTTLQRPPFPRVIDSTIRAEFVECPRKFYWSFLRKLGPLTPSTDLHAGGAYARGHEVIRKSYYVDGLPFPKALEQGILATVEYWGDFEPPANKQAKNLERVLGALVYYYDQWPVDRDYLKPHQWTGGAGIEFTFSLPMELPHPTTGEPLIYAGRCDMIAEYNGQIWVYDDKTTTQLGPSWAEKWNLRGQFSGYAFAARQFGLPVAGAIIRGVSFLKNSYGHAEAITTRPEWLIDRWWEQLHRDVERAIISWQEGYYDYNFSDACVGYSGCPFSKLCLVPDPEPWIEGSYGHRDWDPLAKDPVATPSDGPTLLEVVPLPHQ
jgi:hypothetical protein